MLRLGGTDSKPAEEFRADTLCAECTKGAQDMVKSKTHLRVATVLGALIAICIVGAQPVLAQDDPNNPYLFANAGGPYQGTVGVPITFHSHTSYIGDGTTIEGYYWDWDLDRNYECFTLPVATHAWHSAFSGKVRMHVYGPGESMAWDETSVTVTGPETILSIAVEAADTDLHVYDPSQRHTGFNFASDKVDQKIPDSSYQVTAVGDDKGNQTSIQTVALPLYAAGDYKVKLTGASDDTFELKVAALLDGAPAVTQIYTGQVSKGETVSVNVYAACPKGDLDVMCGELTRSPGLMIDPGKLELTVEPNSVYDVALQVCETFGKVPLESVNLQCSDITGPGNIVLSPNIAFDMSGFTVDPGSQQEVHVRIALPEAFQGKATGTITAKCSAGVSQSVPVTLKTLGKCSPVTVGMGPYEGTVGEPISFDASASHDPDGYIDQYGWDWDDNGSVDEFTQTPTNSHTWDTEFSGTVTLIVLDNDGYANSISFQVTVTDPTTTP